MPFEGMSPLADPQQKHSVHPLSVSCRARYVINTLSHCCSIRVLMSVHPRVLQALAICPSNMKQEVK